MVKRGHCKKWKPASFQGAGFFFSPSRKGEGSCALGGVKAYF
jgi:hypothetical protein